jgi:hypothetical protein
MMISPVLFGAGAIVVGVAMIRHIIPPAWMDQNHGHSLPQDPQAWRSSWVATGWLLCGAGAVLLGWAWVRTIALAG